MSKQMNMRRLTISGGTRNLKYGNERTYFPIIRLVGVWLQEAGFEPGEQVFLFVENGKITIKSKAETDIDAAAIKLFDVFNEPRKAMQKK